MQTRHSHSHVHAGDIDHICRNNLRQFGVAMHNDETANRQLPPGYRYVPKPEGNGLGFSYAMACEVGNVGPRDLAEAQDKQDGVFSRNITTLRNGD